MTLETYKKASELVAQYDEVKELIRRIKYLSEREKSMTIADYTGEYRVVFTGANKEIITNTVKSLLEERLKELEEEIEKI